MGGRLENIWVKVAHRAAIMVVQPLMGIDDAPATAPPFTQGMGFAL
jgi:hypothetical protein